MPQITEDCHYCGCSLPRSVCPESIKIADTMIARGEPVPRMTFYRTCPWERELRAKS